MINLAELEMWPVASHQSDLKIAGIFLYYFSICELNWHHRQWGTTYILRLVQGAELTPCRQNTHQGCRCTGTTAKLTKAEGAYSAARPSLDMVRGFKVEPIGGAPVAYCN